MPTPFNCPMCAAPLDLVDTSAVTMRCPYCSNTVILPEELRGRGAAGGQRDGHAGAGGSLGGVVDQALKMAEVAHLIQAGKKLEAIKRYREIFGGGLKEAKDAVEKIEAGEPVTFAHAEAQADGAEFPQQVSSVRMMQGQGARRRTKGSLPGLIVGLVLFFVVLGFGVAFLVIRDRPRVSVTTPATTAAPVPADKAVPPAARVKPGFENVLLEFGSEGIGAGQFKDARSVAVDGEGRIYVGEYTGGRVQVFDAQGKFVTQWTVDPKRALLNLAADRKGTVYVVHPGHIYRYEGTTGQMLGEVPQVMRGSVREFYTDVFVALDGSLYTIGGNSHILHLGADGKLISAIDAREKIGETISFDKLAVSGAGDIYALERREGVFKFAPDGRYVNRFGGGFEPGQALAPGQFRSADHIAVDGQGRVYVSDSGVLVFDAGGRHLGSLGGTEVVFGLAFNDRDELFAAFRNRHTVAKFAPGKW